MIVDRHTVHYIERLLVSVQGGVTTNDHTAGSAGTRIGLGGVNTGDLTGQGTTDIVHATFRELTALHFLDRITQSPSDLAHTQCCYDNIFK